MADSTPLSPLAGTWSRIEVGAIRTLVLPANTWTALVTPVDCNYYYIVGTVDGSAFLRCTDTSDANTSYTVPSGNGFLFYLPNIFGVPRFKSGDTVTFLKSVAGASVVTEFNL